LLLLAARFLLTSVFFFVLLPSEICQGTSCWRLFKFLFSPPLFIGTPQSFHAFAPFFFRRAPPCPFSIFPPPLYFPNLCFFPVGVLAFASASLFLPLVDEFKARPCFAPCEDLNFVPPKTTLTPIGPVLSGVNLFLFLLAYPSGIPPLVSMRSPLVFPPLFFFFFTLYSLEGCVHVFGFPPNYPP